MANTFSQSYFHLVFAVKHREALIGRQWKNELEKYITGIIQNHKHKLLAINTMPDHINISGALHLLFTPKIKIEYIRVLICNFHHIKKTLNLKNKLKMKSI